MPPSLANSPLSLSRRSMLQRLACGFGSLAMTSLASRAAAPLPHFPPRAKRIIFLFMQGGVSHVDSLDYKPLLESKDGTMLDFDDARSIAKTRKGATQRVMKPLWE